MGKVICKKCLLKDLTDGEYFQNVYEYIESLGEEVRTDDQEYERRLTFCRECDNLVNGMCRHCGCFVEMRAAVRVRHCPEDEARW